MRVLIVTAAITVVIGGLCVGGALFALQRGDLEGSGTIVSDERRASGITRVEIDGPGTLVVRQGNDEGLTITTDDNILETIETEVDEGELSISYDRSGFLTLSRIRPSEDILFELTAPAVTEIEVNGTADVVIDGFQADRLAVEVNGTGDPNLAGLVLAELDVAIAGSSTFEAAGTVERQTIEIDGSGSYRAEFLTSRETVIDIDGSGDATVNVRDTLDVEIDGRGTVEYIGSPTVTDDISGDGEVRQIGTGEASAASPVATDREATPRATPAPTARATPTPLALNPFREPTAPPDE